MEMLKIMDINRDTIISEILSNFPEAIWMRRKTSEAC